MAFAANVTVDGTVATPVLLELRVMVSPGDGAAPDRRRVRNPVAVPLTVRLPGEKFMVRPVAALEPTWTWPLVDG